MRSFFLLLLILIGIIAAATCISKLSVIGPEGLDIKIIAIEYDGRLIHRYDSWVIDDYTRISMWDDKAIKIIHDIEGDSPKNCKGQPGICEYGPQWWYEHDGGSLLVEVSRPQLIASFTPPSGWKSIDSSSYDLSEVREVEWVNELPNGTLVKRVGKIVPAEFIIQITSQERVGEFSLYQFKDINVWFELYGISWTPYDPNPPEGYELTYRSKAFITPLIVWVKAATPWVWERDDGSQVSDYLPHEEMANWLSFYPDLAGREFTMYYSVGEYYGEIPSREDIVNDNPLKYVVPDPRMTDKVYIHLHIGKYGPYAYTECGGWTVVPCCIAPKLEIYYPASYIKVKVLVLVWGEFHYVWTSEESENQDYEWENRTSFDVTILESWLENLLKSLTAPHSILLMIAIVVIVIGVLMLILSPKVIVLRR